MNTIFIESSETLGILWDRYKKLPEVISKFLDVVGKAVNYANKKDIPDIKELDLSGKLADFKKDVEFNVKNPDPVPISGIDSMKSKIQKTKQEVLAQLNKLGKLRHTFKYGNNVVSGVIIKPKVYKNTDDPEELAKVNAYMRIASRCMDWAEKYILDLMNLADQDLNILTLTKTVYYRKITESEWPADEYEFSDIMMESIIDDEYEPWLEGTEEDDEKKDDDVMNKKADNDEKYYPVFSVVYSYDFSKWEQANEEQRACIKRGKVITAFTKGDVYTHTLVSFDTSFENMYHFIGNGFNHDSIYTNPATEITRSIYVNVTFVTKEELDSIKEQINDHDLFQTKTGYSVKILIDQFLGRSNHIDKRQICSTFVAYLLACGNIKNLPRDYSLIRPEDITILPRAFYVMTFKNRDDFKERKDEFKKKVDDIYRDNIDEIREYNNTLPRLIIKEKMKKLGSIDKFVDWVTKRQIKQAKGETPEE